MFPWNISFQRYRDHLSEGKSVIWMLNKQLQFLSSVFLTNEYSEFVSVVLWCKSESANQTAALSQVQPVQGIQVSVRDEEDDEDQ